MKLGVRVKAEDYTDIPVDEEVNEGDEIVVGNDALSGARDPRHTRGGVCYLCGDTLFSGDTLFYREVGRTDLEGGNYPMLLASLRKLDALEGDYTVLPGHDKPTVLGDERKYNFYIQDARQ
jgi:glyoxylase-like metal-dependent hydrolase (beta-lactamase superfamily II)